MSEKGNYTCIVSNEVDSAIRSTLLIVNILPKWNIEPPNKLNAVLGSKLIVDCGKSEFLNKSIKKTINLCNINDEIL